MPTANSLEIAKLRRLINDLDEAIGTGAKSAFSDGERFEFQDTKAMMAARDDFKRRLASLISANRSPWQNYNVRPTMRW